jgi:hypothetical protein
MDLLGVTPVESICVGLNLVLVHFWVTSSNARTWTWEGE